MVKRRGSALGILYRDRLFTFFDPFKIFLDGIKYKHGGNADISEVKLCVQKR